MKFFTKILSFILALCILAVTTCGCANNDNNSSTDLSSKNDSSVSSNDNLSSDNSDTSDDLNLDLDLDISDDIDFGDLVFDLVTNQVFTFGKTPVNSNIKGTGGVLPCWWYFPDSTIDGGYTEEDIRISVEQLKNTNISIVRCVSFQPGYAWDEENNCYNWDTVYMQGFYRYAKVMLENDIEIVINPNRNLAGPEAGEPVCTPFKEASEAGNEEEYNRLYGEWVVELINEVIIKRGFTNVKYLMYNTESSNISGLTADSEEEFWEKHKAEFFKYLGRVEASDKAMRNAGLRDYLKIVGPNGVDASVGSGYKTTTGTRWLKWAVEYGDKYIDIYSAHFYPRVDDFSQDIYQTVLNREKEYLEIVKPTGKELWHDEFNVNLNGNSTLDKYQDDPLRATTLAQSILALYAAGGKSSFLWYLFDVKWPENDKTAPPAWHEGIHGCQGDLCPPVYQSTTPYYSYYMWCAMSSAIRTGDTIYDGTTDGQNLRSILFKHSDGTYSIVAVNTSLDTTNVTYKLPVSLNGKEFSRTVYDPYTVTPTPEYKPLESNGAVKITTQFEDTLGPYQVVVYNQK